MIFDTHMHCQYSIDSKMSAEEAKAAALHQNLGIIITEHWMRIILPTRRLLFLTLKIILSSLAHAAAKNCCWELR